MSEMKFRSNRSHIVAETCWNINKLKTVAIAATTKSQAFRRYYVCHASLRVGGGSNWQSVSTVILSHFDPALLHARLWIWAWNYHPTAKLQFSIFSQRRTAMIGSVLVSAGCWSLWPQISRWARPKIRICFANETKWNANLVKITSYLSEIVHGNRTDIS